MVIAASLFFACMQLNDKLTCWRFEKTFVHAEKVVVLAFWSCASPSSRPASEIRWRKRGVREGSTPRASLDFWRASLLSRNEFESGTFTIVVHATYSCNIGFCRLWCKLPLWSDVIIRSRSCSSSEQGHTYNSVRFPKLLKTLASRDSSRLYVRDLLMRSKLRMLEWASVIDQTTTSAKHLFLLVEKRLRHPSFGFTIVSSKKNRRGTNWSSSFECRQNNNAFHRFSPLCSCLRVCGLFHHPFFETGRRATSWRQVLHHRYFLLSACLHAPVFQVKYKADRHTQRKQAVGPRCPLLSHMMWPLTIEC